MQKMACTLGPHTANRGNSPKTRFDPHLARRQQHQRFPANLGQAKKTGTGKITGTQNTKKKSKWFAYGILPSKIRNLVSHKIACPLKKQMAFSDFDTRNDKNHCRRAKINFLKSHLTETGVHLRTEKIPDRGSAGTPF